MCYTPRLWVYHTHLWGERNSSILELSMPSKLCVRSKIYIFKLVSTSDATIDDQKVSWKNNCIQFQLTFYAFKSLVISFPNCIFYISLRTRDQKLPFGPFLAWFPAAPKKSLWGWLGRLYFPKQTIGWRQSKHLLMWLPCDFQQTDETCRWFVHQRIQQTPGAAVSEEVPGVFDREARQVCFCALWIVLSTVTLPAERGMQAKV